MNTSIYAYPQYYPITSPGCPGDVEFYVDEAKKSGAPVLELGCGTGRILVPIAEAALEIVGIDNSDPMLSECTKTIGHPGRTFPAKTSLQLSDMRQLQMRAEFKTVIIPYRGFLCLASVEDQLKVLEGVYRALVPDGHMILNVFDPDVDTLAGFHRGINTHRLLRSGSISGHTQLITWATTTCDLEQQVIDEVWTYEELDEKENVASRRYGRFRIRYVFRYEMEHLLSRVGFEIEHLYGDFDYSPYQQGREQVWVCKKRV